MNNLQTVIIKTTYDCNMRCRYCYESSKADRQRLPLSRVKVLLEKLRKNSSRSYNLIWHGGEPLISGVDFFQEVINLEKEVGGIFINSIQTNGLLLKGAELDFLLKNNFKIGISLDGPKEIHDLQRVKLGGKGTFDEVWESVKRVRTHPDFNNHLGIIAVFTKHSAANIKAFYKFFHDNQLHFQINELIPSLGKYDDLAPTPKEYGQSLIYLFDSWINEKNLPVNIHPLSDIVKSILRKKPSICIFSGHCYDNFLSIDPDGYVIPCGKWSRDEFVFGHIDDIDFSTIEDIPDYLRYRAYHSQLTENCRECRFFSFCQGGCYYIRHLSRMLTDDPNYYCKSYKMIFSHIHAALKKQFSN